MSSTLRDELASLRIQRDVKSYNGRSSPRRGGDWGMRVLTALLWLVPVGLLSGAGYYGYSQYSKYKPKVEVKTDTIRSQTMADAVKLFEAKGYIRARFRASVGTKVPGRIQDLLVEEGSEVKEGDVIAILEHNEIDAMLETREASKIRADAELVEARSDLANKERKAARQSRLYSQNQASAEDVDLAVTERDKARARVLALEAQIKIIDSQIHEMTETVKNLEIRAPFAGTVLTKTAEKGETINTMSLGAGGGRSALVEIADLRSLEVETEIAEKEVSKVSEGQKAIVKADAAPNKLFPAHVRQLIRMGDRAKGTVKVYVAIDDPESGLFPDLAAPCVRFLPPEITDEELNQLTQEALYVPASALVKQGENVYVWVVDPTGKLERREIKLQTTHRSQRVLSGLSKDEKVVLGPRADFVDGQIVKDTSKAE